MSVLSYALTTVDRWKAYAGISSLTAAQTGVVENLINFATTYIEGKLGRRIMETAYSQEQYDGPYGEFLTLDNYPINTRETFTLEERATNLNEDDWDTVDSDDYFIDYDAGIISPSGRGNWILSKKKYRVTYTAGYDFDNAATFLGDTEAGDLELACWMIVSELWFKKGATGNVKSESLGDYSVTYGPSFLTGMANGQRTALDMILEKYRRVEFEGTLTPANSTDSDEE